LSSDNETQSPRQCVLDTKLQASQGKKAPNGSFDGKLLWSNSGTHVKEFFRLLSAEAPLQPTKNAFSVYTKLVVDASATRVSL
jgi:hypothetical protein